MADPAFVPAQQLCGDFYRQAVRPLLGDHPHAAALLGWGSDVLGYDTPRSTDHGWGPRLQVFVEREDDARELRGRIDAGLPETFAGWPVRFGWDAVAPGHQVEVTTLPDWTRRFLGTDATTGLSDLDWLLTPQQHLLGVTAGAVYADDRGELARLRAALAWYPEPLWRWLLACSWHRIAHTEAFVGRAAEVGDDRGSAVAAARLVADAMRLALLLDRRYAPYLKWLGTAFARGPHEDHLPEHLSAVLGAPTSAEREAALARALEALARRHDAAALTAPLDPSPRDFHARPFQVLMADRFTQALLETVEHPALRALPPIGGVDQVLDSTDALTDRGLFRRLEVLYPGMG